MFAMSEVNPMHFYRYFIDVEDRLQQQHGYTLDESIGEVIAQEERIAELCRIGMCVEDAAGLVCRLRNGQDVH